MCNNYHLHINCYFPHVILIREIIEMFFFKFTLIKFKKLFIVHIPPLHILITFVLFLVLKCVLHIGEVKVLACASFEDVQDIQTSSFKV